MFRFGLLNAMEKMHTNDNNNNIRSKYALACTHTHSTCTKFHDVVQCIIIGTEF